MTPKKLKELAWLGGIIDGEGCFSIGRCRKTYRPSVQVGNTDNKITQKCREITSCGGISKIKGTSSGRKNCKDWTIWNVKGEKACKVAELILPFLVSKIQQAQLLSEWNSLGFFNHKRLPDKVQKQRKFIIKKLKLLNKKGRV